MLKLFYLLELFFEDVYSEISVREYGRKRKLSPPTASKILKEYEKEKLLISSQKGIYLFFRANKENSLFKDLAKSYWKYKLHAETGELHQKILFKNIILFGSLSKVENTKDSDIDLFVDIPRKNIDLKNIEKKLNRKVELHFRESLKNPNLKKNIESGLRIR